MLVKVYVNLLLIPVMKCNAEVDSNNINLLNLPPII